MRLATRRLHALDNVAPLTFPVCGVCEKAIMAHPYEVDGKEYHQGGCLIELGHRVTEQIWKAKEAARIAAEERSRSLDALVSAKAAYPSVIYRPITTTTDGTVLSPHYNPSAPSAGTSGANISGDGNVMTLGTILVPQGLLSSATSGLQARTFTATTTTAAYAAEASWSTDGVTLNDGDAIQFTATVNL